MTSRDEKALPSLLRPEVFIATVGGAGFVPKAPGTAGALVATLAIPVLGDPIALIPALLVVMLVGTWAAGRYMAEEGAHDPGEIVIDEVAGVLFAVATITMLDLRFGPFISATTPTHPLAMLLLIFLLFRLFDIAKPWPVGAIDRKVDGALGVMLDDVAAGIMAGVAYMVIMYAWQLASL